MSPSYLHGDAPHAHPELAPAKLRPEERLAFGGSLARRASELNEREERVAVVSMHALHGEKNRDSRPRGIAHTGWDFIPRSTATPPPRDLAKPNRKRGRAASRRGGRKSESYFRSCDFFSRSPSVPNFASAFTCCLYDLYALRSVSSASALIESFTSLRRGSISITFASCCEFSANAFRKSVPRGVPVPAAVMKPRDWRPVAPRMRT